MSKTKWHSGPPPSVGWWPASVCNDLTCLRWWNGRAWSLPAYAGDGSMKVETAVRFLSCNTAQIFWTDRPASWPERSRT